MYGFNPSESAYEPVKLMQSVIAKTNEVCKWYLDNSKLCSLPAPDPLHTPASAYAIKNGRRLMEDRHVIIHDLNTLFDVKDASPSSYFAVFDGHAGRDAAAYCSAHLHQFLAESEDFISTPATALRDAFLKTDACFLEKCKIENLNSGTTALCALIRHKDKTLYIGWVGDSQAIVAAHGKVISCVQPHKPNRDDERARIEKQGGAVLVWCGVSRVDGQLAVSRAIGDISYKPYVTAVPDVIEVSLRGDEDFLILACDGLWDVIAEQEAAVIVYELLTKGCDDINAITKRLVEEAKHKGSTDNITVITVFLREPSKVVAEARWAARNLTMDTLDNANATNPFATPSPDILVQKDGFVLNLGDGEFKQNGAEVSPPDYRELSRVGNNLYLEDFDDSDDAGPETDVDAVDDEPLSPVKSLPDKHQTNNANNIDPFDGGENGTEKATLETDSECQKPMEDAVPQSPLIGQDHQETAVAPPADTVLAGGLVENVADSGEDSDDEWNYYKGDSAKQEQSPTTQTDKEVGEVDVESELDVDAMSQLNPNAAEFVPVSPKRGETLIDETVIAQSPRRPVPLEMDINVPNPQEFESEVKSRPSDVQTSNGCEEDSAQQLSTQELMQNLLNGKPMEEIEFQPNATPTKTPRDDELFHFGPNASPFSTPSKLNQSEVSTRAVLGDESTQYLDGKELDAFAGYVDGVNVLSKEQADPMSASFYQDRDDATGTNNPFDLNKVQALPDDLEEFLNTTPAAKPADDALVETVDVPLPPSVTSVTPDLIRDDLVTVTQITETVECQSSAGLAGSSLTQTTETSIHSDKDDQCDLSARSQSHTATTTTTTFGSDNLFTKEQQADKEGTTHQADLATMHDDARSTTPMTPDAQRCLFPVQHSPIDQVVAACAPPRSPSPAPYDLLQQSVGAHEPFAPNDDNDFLHVGEHTRADVESPLDDVTSSVKDSPLSAASPIDNQSAHVRHEEAEATLIHELSTFDDQLLVQSSTVESSLEKTLDVSSSSERNNDAESVVTADVHSILERSPLPDMTSPLSPSDDVTREQSLLLNVSCTPDLVMESHEETTTTMESSTKIVSSGEAEVVSAAAAATAVTAVVAATAAVAAEKKHTKPRSETAIRRSTAPKTPTAATTTTTTKADVKPSPRAPLAAARTSTTKTTLTKTTATAAASATKAPLRARAAPATTTAAKVAAEKKPLTNGDVKPLPRTTLTRKAPLPAAASKPSRPSTTTATAAKTDAKSSSSTTSASRPSTAPPRAPIERKSLASACAPKPRPTTLTSRTTTSSTKTATTTASTVTKTTLKTSLSSPRPRPISATKAAPAPSTTAPKPRVPATKPLPRAPDAAKQLKDTVNKQTARVNAAATSRLGSAAGRTVTAKVDTKGPVRSSTASTRTTTVTASTMKATSKKPTEIVRNATSKTKTTVIKKTADQNGIINEVTTIISQNNIEPHLVKDASPFEKQFDNNSHLTETNVTD